MISSLKKKIGQAYNNMLDSSWTLYEKSTLSIYIIEINIHEVQQDPTEFRILVDGGITLHVISDPNWETEVKTQKKYWVNG